MPTVRLERPGLFGPVGVVDTADARRFTIRGVLQGASLLVPAASSVEPALGPGPGPVIETRYQLAWFLAGQRHPSGHGLMLGFGGGTGAAGLLAEFPELRLDAVDADASMVAMAREFHPLVPHFEAAGRLSLRVADAEEFLSGNGRAYDFVVADLVVDADSTSTGMPRSLLAAVATAAPEIWFRAFGSLPDGELTPVARGLAAGGAPVDWLYSPVSLALAIPRTRDWILACGLDRPPASEGFCPFTSSRGPRVRAVQAAYRKLAAQSLPARTAGLAA